MATEESLELHGTGTHERPHPGPGEYVKVAFVLAVVTAIEVGAYYVTSLPRPVFSATLLVMMVVKFSLVALWFMHLRFDSHLFRRLFVGGIILALVIYTVVLLTFGLLLD
jgi:cytochrome c oxidase subunit 4